MYRSIKMPSKNSYKNKTRKLGGAIVHFGNSNKSSYVNPQKNDENKAQMKKSGYVRTRFDKKLEEKKLDKKCDSDDDEEECKKSNRPPCWRRTFPAFKYKEFLNSTPDDSDDDPEEIAKEEYDKCKAQSDNCQIKTREEYDNCTPHLVPQGGKRKSKKQKRSSKKRSKKNTKKRSRKSKK